MLKDEKYSLHKPVLVKEVNQAFGLIAPLKFQARKSKKRIIIDATVGGGGHAAEFIKTGVFVLGIDADDKMIKIAGANLRKVVDELDVNTFKSSKLKACPTGNYEEYFRLVNENFIFIDKIARINGLNTVDGVLLDLGISSYHYRFNKGFSFQNPESPLDMRLSENQRVTAADLLNALPRHSLTDLFCVTMPFSEGKRLAIGITKFRNTKKIDTVGDLLDVIRVTFPYLKVLPRKKSISFPTLPFLALRIAVNSELDNLIVVLKKAWNLLNANGRLVVISFHSGEDKIVKNYFNDMEKEGSGKIIYRLLRPSKSEIENNLRARSAKMRVIEKI